MLDEKPSNDFLYQNQRLIDLKMGSKQRPLLCIVSLPLWRCTGKLKTKKRAPQGPFFDKHYLIVTDRHHEIFELTHLQLL